MAAFCTKPDELLLVVPADHLLEPAEHFIEALGMAIKVALDKKLVTFGIQPSYAKTGYGYIHAKQSLQENVFKIESFVEKLNAAMAEKYVADGHYFWNSGMFLFSASTYLKELKQHAPDIYSVMQLCTKELKKDGYFSRVNEVLFLECPNISIDYAVMEKTQHSVMIKLELNWNDIGSWQSICECEKKDESFFISQKMKHSVANDRDTLLSLVEVQSGNVLVETDIERH